MVLSLGLRFAVLRLFAEQVGIVVMDEPTAGLDNRNRGYLAEAFDCLRRWSRSAGYQIIVVTHDEELKDSFDQVLSLPVSG